MKLFLPQAETFTSGKMDNFLLLHTIHLAVLDSARRGYLGFPVSKKRLRRGKQTFYFKWNAMKRAVLSAPSIAA